MAEFPALAFFVVGERWGAFKAIRDRTLGRRWDPKNSMNYWMDECAENFAFEIIRMTYWFLPTKRYSLHSNNQEELDRDVNLRCVCEIGI